MKKRLCLLLSIFIALSSFSACGNSGNTEEAEETETTSYSAEETARQYVLAAFEGNIGKCYDLRFIDNVTREQAVADYADANDMTSKEFFENLSEQANYGKEKDEQVSFSDYNEFLAAQNVSKYTAFMDYYTEEYGKDYTITVEILSSESPDENTASYYRSELNDLIEYFEEFYSTDVEFDGDDVEEFLEITYEVTVEGRDDEGVFEEMTIILAKIGGKWTVCQCDSDQHLNSLGVADVGFVPTNSYYY